MDRRGNNRRGRSEVKRIRHPFYYPEAVITNEPLKLGISACLLGEKVRYDGGHKLDPFLVDTLGRFVEYVPVCPEAECGLGIPREAMHLAGNPSDPRLVTIRTGFDHTDRMRAWAAGRLDNLTRENLCGFIFKSRSPSSGMERVKVYGSTGVTLAGVGIFARMFMDRFPLLPVEDEGRLHDPELRENFIERVFVMRRWRDCIGAGKNPANLVGFHTLHKLLIMAHSVEAYRELGPLVASAGAAGRDALFDSYIARLSTVLKLRATVKKHRNVLLHIAGYFKKNLASDEKAEIVETIDSYAAGHIPLIVPVTLLNHYVRKYDQSYLRDQVYLNPHPVELKLRNHA